MLEAALKKEADKLLACVHCGLCLPACPTYRQLGNENDSPRGRVYLMRAVAEGKLEVSDTYHKHIDLCLGCRACETACPSGVRFGNLLEIARAEITENNAERLSLSTRVKQSVTGFVLKHIFSRPRLLNIGWSVAKRLRRNGLVTLALDAGLFRFAPQLEFSLALLEQAGSNLPAARALTGRDQTAPPVIAPTRRIAQFTGCVMEGLFTETNRATTFALEQNGCRVEIPSQQVCCGALHAHSGFHSAAVALAKTNIDAFAPAGTDDDTPIVVNAAGCGAMLKEYGELLADDPHYSARARAFSARVKDISEVLAHARCGGAVEARITYDAPCHLYHGQAVREQPISLLKTIPGLQFVPLTGADACCGSAGIYNITHPEMASRLLQEKLENIRKTGAQILVTGNPGCAMHIGAGARLAGMKLLVLHPVEMLSLSYENQPTPQSAPSLA